MLLLLTATSAEAQPRRLFIGGPGSCPEPSEVARLVRDILLDVALTDRAADADIHAQLSDSAGGFLVTVDGLKNNEKWFSDPQQRCVERVKTAAVFIALSVKPPPSASVPVAAEPIRKPVEVDLELSAIGDGAPGDSLKPELDLGGGLRLAVMSKYVGGSLGFSAAAPATLALRSASAELLRLPADLSLRGRYRWGKVELDGDLGVALTTVRIVGVGLPVAATTYRLDPQIRFSAVVGYFAHSRIAPFVGLQAFVSPKPLDITLDPQGKVGTLPAFWLGINLGLRLRLD